MLSVRVRAARLVVQLSFHRKPMQVRLSTPYFPPHLKESQISQQRTDVEHETAFSLRTPYAPRRRSPCERKRGFSNTHCRSTPRSSVISLEQTNLSNEPNARTRPYRPNTPSPSHSPTPFSRHSTTQRSRRALEDDPGVPSATHARHVPASLTTFSQA